MVAQGWALAYRQFSDDYVTQEGEAREAGLGMWRGWFVDPWDWPPRGSSRGRSDCAQGARREASR